MRCAFSVPTRLSVRRVAALLALAWTASACNSKEVLWPGPDAARALGGSTSGGSGSADDAGANGGLPPTCTRTLPAAPSSTSDVNAATTRGLVAWRKPMAAGSCAGCHGPDAIDLARIGYTDSDILMRATSQGLGSEDAQAIVDFVHALRARYAIALVCQPDAPLFQPGGQVLSGNSNEDRDFALLDELRRHAVDLGQAVTSADAASALVAGLKRLDPLTLGVGFPLALWSAPPALTGERATQFQWLPDRATEPLPGQEAAWYALADAYLANPTDAALWAIHQNIGTLTALYPAAPEAEQTFGSYQTNKFQAVLVASHMLRSPQLTYPSRVADLPVDDGSTIRYQRSPLWDLANFSGTYNAAHALSGTPPDVIAKYGYTADDAVSQDVSRFVAPFGWLAVGFDPARQFSGERGNGNIGLIDNGFLNSLQGLPQFILHRRVFEILLEVFRVEREDERYGSMAHKPPLPNGQWASAEIPAAPADDLPPQTSDYTQNQLFAYRQLNLLWFRTELEMVRADLAARHAYNQGTLDALAGRRDYLLANGPAEQRSAVSALYAAITDLAAQSVAE